MPRSNTKHSASSTSGDKGGSKRQPVPTHAEQEKAKREEALKDSTRQLKEIIVTYINTMKAHRKLEPWQFATKPWDEVEADLAKIDNATDRDISKTEREMRNLNIRATNMYIDELEQRVKRAKDRNEDADTIRELEGNLEYMKKNRGKAVFPQKKRKVEDEVD